MILLSIDRGQSVAGISNDIETEYGSLGLGARILVALEEAGVANDELTLERLAPADHIHGGGLAATIEHASMIPFGPDTRVLDIGCGIGGPARYLATAFECRVTGIDLTADFIEAAQLLTEKMGLQELVDFECVDATNLPYNSATFDVVWSQNVTMNIQDRQGFYDGAHQVLRSGGILTLTEMCQGPNGIPDYPLTWARDPSYSFLATPEQTRKQVEAAGFHITEWREASESRADGARAKAPSKSVGSAQTNPLTIELIRGNDYSTRRANSSRCVLEGRLVPILLVAERLN